MVLIYYFAGISIYVPNFARRLSESCCLGE